MVEANTTSSVAIQPQQLRINCTICCEPFTFSDGPRIPLVLASCGHTFCQKCLEGISAQTQSRSILCPTCRAVCDLDTEAKRNYRLIDVLSVDFPNNDQQQQQQQLTVQQQLQPSAPPLNNFEQISFSSSSSSSSSSSPSKVTSISTLSPTTTTTTPNVISYLPCRIVQESANRNIIEWLKKNSISTALASPPSNTTEIQLELVLIPFWAVVIATQGRVFQDKIQQQHQEDFSDEADFIKDAIICGWNSDKERKLIDATFPPFTTGFHLKDLINHEEPSLLSNSQTTTTTTTTTPSTTSSSPPSSWLIGNSSIQVPNKVLSNVIVPQDSFERARFACEEEALKQCRKRASEISKGPGMKGTKLGVSAVARIARKKLFYVPFYIGNVGNNYCFVDGVLGRVGGERSQSPNSSPSVTETLKKIFKLK